MIHSNDLYDKWLAGKNYRYADAWINRETICPEYHFQLDLAVAPNHKESEFRAGSGDNRIVLGGATVERFVLDTGASVTVLTKALATKLGLQLDLVPCDAKVVGGHRVPVVTAEILANVGSRWCLVPCIIPTEDFATSENLLGLCGLFDKHLFCVDRDALSLFRRC